MQQVFRWTLNLSTALSVLILYLIFTGKDLTAVFSLPSMNAVDFQNFKTIFISIFLEALPFILLGVFISSILNFIVSEKMLRRMIPANPVIAVILASLLGIILPICECGMIPIVRRLINKGMPVHVGLTYILAAPIINPVTYFATYMAFRTQPEMANLRMGLAFAAVCAIGLTVYITIRKNPIKSRETQHHSSGIPHHREHNHDHKNNKLITVFTHASDEFFEMGKYLLMGSFITAGILIFVGHQQLASLGSEAWSSHLLMMGFAYILSLCSTSDAFVAASFSGAFSKGPLLTFLVFGPMLDLKNTLMMLSVFRARFVLQITLIIILIVFLLSLLTEKLFL